MYRRKIAGTHSESEVAQSCPTLCDPMDYSLPGSSVHGIFQARILEWLSFPSLGDLPNPGIEPMSLEPPALARGFFTTWEAIGYIHISSCNLKKKCFYSLHLQET